MLKQIPSTDGSGLTECDARTIQGGVPSPSDQHLSTVALTCEIENFGERILEIERIRRSDVIPCQIHVVVANDEATGPGAEPGEYIDVPSTLSFGRKLLSSIELRVAGVRWAGTRLDVVGVTTTNIEVRHTGELRVFQEPLGWS